MISPTQDYPYLIYDRCLDLQKSEKQPCQWNNYELAKIFEYYSAIQLSTDESNMWVFDDICPNYKEEHRLSQTDTGIDLCNMKDTIVQCKLRAKTLNWGEVGTFFASNYRFDSSGNKIIAYQREILYRNSESQLSNNLRHHCQRFEDITVDRNTVIAYCEELLKNPPKQRIIQQSQDGFNLREYQTESIDTICNSINKNCIICLPTGCGKNAVIIFAMLKLLQQNPNSRFLFLVPRIILMEQLQEEILRFLPQMKKCVLLLGDGKSVFANTYKITISIYNSVGLIPNDEIANFTRVFIDEAHHIFNPLIYQDEDEYFEDSDESLSEDENDDLSETEQSLSEDELEKTYLNRIRDFETNNNNVYLSATIDERNNCNYYKQDIRNMIEQCFLSDYDIRIPIFSGKDSTPNSICKYVIEKFRSIIIYAKNCKEGREICASMNSIMNGCCEYVDCNTSKRERKRILNGFNEGKIAFIVNVRILCEGFNSPITNGVLFFHMPSSKTTMIQIIGRALRLHPNKSLAHIILPYSTDEDNTCINTFLKEIASNDRRVMESRRNRVQGGYISIEPSGNEGDECNMDIVSRGELIYNSLGEFINAEDRFIQRLGMVKNYIRENGKLPSRNDKIKEIKSLAIWISIQKKYRKECKYSMSNEHIRALWDEFIQEHNGLFLSNEQIWILIFEKVKEYIRKNNKRPSISDKNKEIRSLSNWIREQKKNRNECKSIMANEYIRNIWDDNKELFLSNEEQWYSNLEKLKDYIQTHNKLPSTYDKIREIISLSKWVEWQKKKRIECINIMKNENIRAVWDEFVNKNKELFLSNEQIWISNLEHVKKYINEYKKPPYISDKNKDIKFLAKWISHQRENRKKRIKIMKNENMCDLWDDFIEEHQELFLSNEQIWISNLEKVKEYVRKNNKHPSISDKNKDIKSLGIWIYHQNHNRKNCIKSMETEQIRALWDEFISEFE